jgi:hypothetical protein
MFVTVSRRFERATMNGRSPKRSARAKSRSRSQGGMYANTSPPFRRANEDLVALQARDVEKRGIRNPEPGVDHQPNEVLQLLAGPDPDTRLILPLDLYLVARSDDSLHLVIGEGRLVSGLTGPDRRFDVDTGRRFGNPLAIDGEPEERAESVKALPLRTCTELPVGPKEIDVGRHELVEEHVTATSGAFRDLRVVNVRYLRKVAGASSADSRLVMKTLHASSMVMRERVGFGVDPEATGAGFGSPVQESAFS